MKRSSGPEPRPPDDQAQSDRFISTAKQLEADESGVSFECASKAVAPGVKPGAKREPKA